MQELKIQPSLNSQLIPPHLGGGEGGDAGAGLTGAAQGAVQEADKQV